MVVSRWTAIRIMAALALVSALVFNIGFLKQKKELIVAETATMVSNPYIKPRPKPLLLEKLKNRTIPHILHFLDTRYNILEAKEPRHFYENIQNTISMYETAWNAKSKSNAKPVVYFWTDPECISMINQTAPFLLEAYKSDPHGPNKSDICRLAALFIHGGYYFDNDMRVLNVFEFDDMRCSFATASCRSGVMNTFVAVAPQHPWIPLMLQAMHAAYKEKALGRKWHPDLILLGPFAMNRAIEDNGLYREPYFDKQACVLQEDDLEVLQQRGLYRNTPRQVGTGWACNYVLHSYHASTLYFFSRIPGVTPDLCGFPK